MRTTHVSVNPKTTNGFVCAMCSYKCTSHAVSISLISLLLWNVSYCFACRQNGNGSSCVFNFNIEEQNTGTMLFGVLPNSSLAHRFVSTCIVKIDARPHTRMPETLTIYLCRYIVSCQVRMAWAWRRWYRDAVNCEGNGATIPYSGAIHKLCRMLINKLNILHGITRANTMAHWPVMVNDRVFLFVQAIRWGWKISTTNAWNERVKEKLMNVGSFRGNVLSPFT